MRNIISKYHITTNEFKFGLCVIFCILVHSLLIVFGAAFNIAPLALFNIFSVAIYTACLFLMKNHQWMVYYFMFVEIVTHSFLCVILIGNKFGFSMYFILLVPMSYSLLYSIHVKKPILKASLAGCLSFAAYMVCYYISAKRQPVFQSPALQDSAPYIYVANMFITFVTLMVFSVLFLIETEAAFSQLNDKNRQLETLANTDPLTGLYNRRTMAEQIKVFYSDYVNRRRKFSLVICDIDNFKLFNDNYGHDCGDEVLKLITEKLSSLIRAEDYLCRWGGEEFLVLFCDIDLEEARKIAERFRASIEQMEMTYNDLQLYITMTFGVACVTEAENYNHMFKLADQRLYAGKNEGKNCVR